MSLLISLGGRCETRWQIDHYLQNDNCPTFPFDWLVTPFESVTNLIQNKFKKMVDENSLHISYYWADFHKGIKKQTIFNSHYNIFLHHEFERDSKGNIVEGWQDAIPQVAEKFDFLSQRFFDTLKDNSHILFFRRRGNFSMPEEREVAVTNDMINNLYNILTKHTKQPVLAVCDQHIKVDNPLVLSGTVGEASYKDWASRDDFWQGATSGWQRFIQNSIAKREALVKN